MTGLRLPEHDTLFYGGDWHRPTKDAVQDVYSPATGERIARVSLAGKEDVDRAVKAATSGFETWRRTAPLQRGAILREIAAIVERNGPELAALDAADCGNPIKQ